MEQVIEIMERRLMVARELADRYEARGWRELHALYAARSVELEFALAEIKALAKEEA